MPQFFVKSANISGARCIIEGSDYRHLTRARRVMIGDFLNIRAEDGTLAKVKVIRVTGSSVEAEIVGEEPARLIPVRLTLCVSLLKGTKMDFVIRKAVEIGADRIVSFISERSVPMPGEKAKQRAARWNRIAAEAAKQSMRERIPAVEDIQSFDSAVNMNFTGEKIIAHPSGMVLGQAFSTDTHEAALMIGPEGGFTGQEIALACGAGWKLFNFGFSELRAETAALIFAAILIHEWTKNENPA